MSLFKIINQGLYRSSNIELLRIFCVFSVITHHICNAGPEALNATVGVANVFTQLLYSLTIIGVNTFMLISGYFSIDNKSIKIGKSLDLLIEVVILQLFGILLYFLSDYAEPKLTIVIWAFVPKSYFVMIYIAVFLLSPWINNMVANISKKQYLVLLLCMTFLFSVWNMMFNLFGDITGLQLSDVYTVAQFTTDRGYTFVIFLLMYLWGGVYKTLQDI